MNAFNLKTGKVRGGRIPLFDRGHPAGELAYKSDDDLKRINLVLAAPALLEVVQELFDDLGNKRELTEQGRHFESIARAALMIATPENFDP